MKCHWYSELLTVLCFLGIAILKAECAVAAGTAYRARLKRWAPMFRWMRIEIRIKQVGSLEHLLSVGLDV